MATIPHLKEEGAKRDTELTYTHVIGFASTVLVCIALLDRIINPCAGGYCLLPFLVLPNIIFLALFIAGLIMMVWRW